MKIWRFYKKPNKTDVNKRYDLYALTNKKDLAKEFMDTRNMDMFITKCDKDEMSIYSKLANENRDSVLEVKELVTKKINKNGLYGIKNVKVVMTEYEYQLCDADEFQCEIMTETWWIYNAPNYNIFNKEIQKALNYLYYTKHHDLFTQGTPKFCGKEDSYDAPDMWVDELGAFIKVAYYSFK